MTKSREEVEKLKRNWFSDPCWDIYDTEGFEDYRDELIAYQNEQEQKWKADIVAHNKKLDEKARELGIEGVYRLVLAHEELLDRHMRAIEELADGHSNQAYRILNGYED